MLLVRVFVRVCVFNASAHAQHRDRCSRPGQPRVTVTQEGRKSERKRATLLKVPTGQSFEVARIGIT